MTVVPPVRRLRRPVARRLIVLALSVTQCQFELSPRLICEMKNGGDGFDVEDEYGRFLRRQRIHRMHHVGYAVSAVLILIGMLIFWH